MLCCNTPHCAFLMLPPKHRVGRNGESWSCDSAVGKVLPSSSSSHPEPPSLAASPHFTSSLLLSPPWLLWSLTPVDSASWDMSSVSWDREQQHTLLAKPPRARACRTPVLRPRTPASCWARDSAAKKGLFHTSGTSRAKTHTKDVMEAQSL